MTPGQLFAVGLFGLGIWMLVTRLKAAKDAEKAAHEAGSSKEPSDADGKKTATQKGGKDKAAAAKKPAKKPAKKADQKPTAEGASKGARKRARKKSRKRR